MNCLELLENSYKELQDQMTQQQNTTGRKPTVPTNRECDSSTHSAIF